MCEVTDISSLRSQRCCARLCAHGQHLRLFGFSWSDILSLTIASFVTSWCQAMVAVADGNMLQESLVRDRQGGLDAQRPDAPAPRHHHLDWIRSIMVLFVVFAHISLMGLKGTVNLDGRGIQIDDRTWAVDNPSSLGVRWIALVRPFCLPMLFWVSGAAVSFSYKGVPPGLCKLALFTLIGLSCNAALWEHGPKDPNCGPQNPCPHLEGRWLDFTVVPGVGRWFAILFQMWYTAVLMVLLLVNWPLFALANRAPDKNLAVKFLLLCVQWCMSMSLYTVFLAEEQKSRLHESSIGGFDWRLERSVLKPLALYEAIYLLLSPLAASCQESTWKVPTRVFHYLAAGVAVLQFACTPFAQHVDSISCAFILYIVVGFNKFFTLGFLMTKAKKTKALTYNVWPVLFVIVPAVAPSTNFFLAGNLTFPYFPSEKDRVLYVAFALVVVFIVDRIGRETRCKPLPPIVLWSGLVLYLFHPAIIAYLVKEGFKDGVYIWFATAAIALGLTAAIMVCAWCFDAGHKKCVAKFPNAASVPPSWRPYNMAVTV